MNQETDSKDFFLSWQGQVTGPYAPRDIRNLLKLGKIHSLYRIQIEGQWILLRDHLATLEKDLRDEAGCQAARSVSLQAQPSQFAKPITVAKEVWKSDVAVDPGREQPSWNETAEQPPAPIGIAITSFALSLFFFVPFLNGITWLLALIFGHLALTNTESRPSGKAATLAWVGLWITYVMIGYFLVGLAWSTITEILPITTMYFLLHGQMLGSALGALIGAGVLMLAVKLSSDHLIRFTSCYVGALLPSAIGALGIFFLQVNIMSNSLSSGRGLLLIVLLNLILFIGQIFFWARFIRLPNDEELGLSRATLTSLLYTIVFILVGLGYSAIFDLMISEIKTLFP